MSLLSNVNSNRVPPLTCTEIVDKVQVPGTCNDLSDDLQVSASLTKESYSSKVSDHNVSLDTPSLDMSKCSSKAPLLSKEVSHSTLCIKNKQGENDSIDLGLIKDIVITNSIQVSKAIVDKKTGDVYVDLPNKDEGDKLVPLLDSSLQGNTVITLSKKIPIITIRNVHDFKDKDEFLEVLNHKMLILLS